jgi:hemoglobin
VAPGTTDGSVEQIGTVVDLFYSYVHADPLIGPIFQDHVKNWDGHMAAMKDFWATHLLGSPAYTGNAFAPHMRLPLEEAHFDRWLALWERAATESLPPALADRAIKKARHMANSFKVGVLPWKR